MRWPAGRSGAGDQLRFREQGAELNDVRVGRSGAGRPLAKGFKPGISDWDALEIVPIPLSAGALEEIAQVADHILGLAIDGLSSTREG